jgi:hypothetical protein
VQFIARGRRTVPVMAQKDYGQQFGVMFVPRFGPNWQFTVAAGTGRHDILDAGEIGHYTDTAMPETSATPCTPPTAGPPAHRSTRSTSS